MESNATITLRSAYGGEPSFELALAYGELNFIKQGSGQGKTALGLFLRDESFRRLGIEASTSPFIPSVNWEIVVDGSLGFVEYLSVEGAKGRLLDYLNLKAPLQTLFAQRGEVRCTSCGAEVYQRGGREFCEALQARASSHLLLGIGLAVKPQLILSLLEWARSHSVSRALVNGKIISLPNTPDEDASFGSALFKTEESNLDLMLVREVLRPHTIGADFAKSIGEVLDLAEVASTVLGVKALPELKLGEVLNNDGREFALDIQFSLSTSFLCLSCAEGFQILPERQIDDFTLAQIQQVKLKELAHFFEKYFPSDWRRIFEIDLGEFSLIQSVEEIPEELLIELKLLSLLISEISDSILFIDSKLSSQATIYAVELKMLGNAIISHHCDGTALTGFLPHKLRRPSEILDRKQSSKRSLVKRNSIEPLIVETGIEKSIVELFASLPEARVRNLAAKDLSFHAAKCLECSGTGYSLVNIASLGKIAEVCRSCRGFRYQERVLFVKYQENSLAGLLELSIEQASELFSKRPEIAGQLVQLMQLGLSSYRLGDQWRTLPSSAKMVLV